jgi:SpoVK/Ycf46/Vps4 family AAA+-type ATPase
VPAPLGPQGVVTEHFGVPRTGARIAAWTESLALTIGAADDTLAETLGGRFRLCADQIRDAALTARRLAVSRGADGASAVPEPADFFAAARAQCNHELASVASRVEPSATWSDIVLPSDSVAQLQELCARVAFSHRVLEEWGFDRRLSHGKGIAALFSGPSGTGKTMAAEVIANELGLDLYRVEIPSIVSKWIGETEKNLDKVFRLAENAILFFDEADALFGKRSDVRDAHDRYANVEISYLLQRMETFEGLAILATNVRHHLDEAFLRRLTFVVQFPFPDDAQRQAIWERIWPAQTPLAADLDFPRIARMFRLSGGNVKNVALAAAFGAAARGEAVGLDDVVHAVRREYQKLGKNLAEDELAQAGHMAVAGVRA